ncbi:MAG: DUF6056 family protein [Casimicrobiaceae bacterium]
MTAGLRVLRSVALATAGVLTLSTVALGWANWPAADDYCNAMLVADLGVDGALAWLYTQWSGRLATGAVLYGAVARLEPPALHWVSALVAAGVALTAWQITAFVLGRARSVRPMLFAAVLAALVLGLYPLLGQTVYWPTGGVVYWLPLVLLLHWLNGTRALVSDGVERFGTGYAFVSSAILGNAIELVVPIAVTYLVAMGWRSRNVRRTTQALLLRAGGVLVGALVLVTAPGNFLRAQATPGSLVLDPAVLGPAYLSLLREAAGSGVAMLGIVLLVLLVGFALQRSPASAGWARPAGASRLDEAAALAVGGLLSVVPVLAAPAQAAPRNTLYLLVAILVASLLVGVPRAAARWSTPTALVLVLLAAVGSVIATVRLVDDRALAMARRDAQLERHARLADPSQRGTDVAVRPIAITAPATLHAIDITADPSALVNWCVASVYRLRSVRIDAAATP